MKFKTGFDRFVCVGDHIDFEHESGMVIRATIHPDEETSPNDFDCYDPRDIGRWNDGEWFYSGLVLSVRFDDIVLVDCVASIWGLETNLAEDDSHISYYADELLNESIDDALSAVRGFRDRLVKAG